jgi:hypothetical protein
MRLDDENQNRKKRDDGHAQIKSSRVPVMIGVASSTPGHALKGTDRNRMLGAVVGKALEPLSEGVGVIQVLVTLQ